MRQGLFIRLLRYAECCAAHVCSTYTALLEFGKPCTRIKILMPCFVSGLMLSGCGYHLVGHGDSSGAIPEDVVSVSVESPALFASGLVSALKRQLDGSDRYKVIAPEDVVDESTHAVIRVEQVSEQFVPSAYDASGIATQYRLTLRGRVVLYREGRRVWESGSISKAGDVFVAGGPSGIEASRRRIREDIEKEWVYAAVSRINSGF